MCVCVCRVAAETAQFWLGLGQLGNIISQHPDTCQRLLVSSGTKLTLTELKHLYAIKWSPVGSNRRNEEEEAVFYFELFLADCESKLGHFFLADISITGHTLMIFCPLDLIVATHISQTVLMYDVNPL